MYPEIRKYAIFNVVLPLYEFLTGRNIVEWLKRMEPMQWLSLSEIQEIQWKRLKDILSFAYHEVPFYRQRFEQYKLNLDKINSLEDFVQIPLLDKDEIMRNLPLMIAPSSKKDKLLCTSTGGSTGRSIIFYQGTRKFASSWASRIRGDRYAGFELGEKAAWLWGSDKPDLKFRLKNFLLNYQWLNAFDLSELSMRKYIQQLNLFKPKCIFGYASALDTLAKFIQSEKQEVFSPSAIISSAEVLYKHQRERIEKLFNCKVFNRYGCREIGLIAMECEHGNLHLNADNLYVEFLKDGHPVRNGEIGEIVITDLQNYTMPFIRYRIEDMGIPSSEVRCPCGRGLPVVEQVIGRNSDIFVSATGKMLHGEYFTHLFYGVNEIKQFQLVQKQKEYLILRIVPNERYVPAVLTPIINKIKAAMEADTDIQIEIVDEIPLTRSGKHRFTISEVPIQF
ncbi:phenylacetate--CoA ligase family protein [Candidatus Poribacteria bacterium]|nr:phenylacetate--CoA ligase family protein [Candidatus Poribacteria bacterium]